MIRSLRAEMVKLPRPSVRYAGGAAFLLFALLATVLTFVTAKARPATFNVATTPATSLGQLSGAGGLTRGFAIAGGFLGLVVFVLFMTSVTGEYGQGTIRSLLTRQPARARLLGGKMLALVACVAAALLVAGIVSAAVALPLARVRDVSTALWFTGSGLRHATGDYLNALLAAVCYGVVGATIGVLVRSTPVVLGLGIAWLGPIEHITQLSWSDAARRFPGLLFDALAVGGTDVASCRRALAISVGTAAVAFVIGAVSFLRRDVSA
jgi:ABC-2 type transport system permease protein